MLCIFQFPVSVLDVLKVVSELHIYLDCPHFHIVTFEEMYLA